VFVVWSMTKKQVWLNVEVKTRNQSTSN
jgi:hypothetical protein